MRIRIGYELVYEFPRPTPMILTLNVHYSRASDLLRPSPDHHPVDPGHFIPRQLRQLVQPPGCTAGPAAAHG